MKQSKTLQVQKASATENSTTAACDTGEKMAIAVDPDLKAAAVRRLRRIAGQVRGLEAMVDQERYCADILVQVASVQEALRGVSRLLMRNHLEHCATMAIRDGGDTASAMYDELLDLVYRHAR
ncbi:MAG TPA: metal-sensitive transcriptional regulator [Acidobacteriaceae bacterium]|nr:metal-sensitive transcriptional regulator [Acidobacteriaceae bacterium]